MSNKMSDLLDKIERRLGTRPLNLPDHLKKDKWADEVIIRDTIPTFSRYFPHKIKTMIDGTKRKDRYYFIDESIAENYEIMESKISIGSLLLVMVLICKSTMVMVYMTS